MAQLIKKGKYFCIFFIVLFLLTSCWDKQEIDDQQFVISIGIDKNMEDTISSNVLPNRYLITYTTPNLATIQSKGGGGTEPSRFSQSTVGDTMTGTTKKAITHYLEPLNFDHVKTIILGKALAEDKRLVQEVLDYLDRNPQFSRTIPIFIADGTAKEILEQKEEGRTFRNRYAIQDRDITAIPDELIIDIGKVLSQLENSGGTTFIPKIFMSEKNIGISGGAVFRDYQFQGWLAEREVRALSWLLGKNRRGYFPISYQETYIPYEVSNVTSNLISASYDEFLKVKLEIKTEGDMSEYTLDSSQFPINTEWIKEIEDEMEKQIEKEIKELIYKLQREYKVDILRLNNKIRIKYPEIWKEIEKDYEKIFENAQIEVEIKLSIRRIGMYL